MRRSLSRTFAGLVAKGRAIGVGRGALMLAGFAAAFTGDYFLVWLRSGVRQPGFLCGVVAFACAHILWAAANVRGSKVAWKALPVVLLPVLGLFAGRVRGNIPDTVLVAVSAYAVVSACSLAVAIGTRRWFYSLGVGCLVVSDLFIACRWTHAPFWGGLVGPVYLASLVLVAVSAIWGGDEPRFVCGRGDPLPATMVGGALSVGFFFGAMAACPAAHYNPLCRMLSYLGRTEVKGVAYPLSHYLFCLGMAAGAFATLHLAQHLRAAAPGRARQEVVGWGAAVCAGGLFLIAAVPEDVKPFWHNAGCWHAMWGGVAMLVALAFDWAGKAALAVLSVIAAVFAAMTLLDWIDVLPFSPYVPTTQKMVIVSFILWQLTWAVRISRRRVKRR